MLKTSSNTFQDLLKEVQQFVQQTLKRILNLFQQVFQH